MRRHLTIRVLLATLVVGSAALAQTPARKLYQDQTERGSARLFYWGRDYSLGHCVISHGKPRWTREFQKALAAKPFRLWRFGKNHWSTLDCDVKLEFPTGIEVPAGYYYLALDKRKVAGSETFGLILLDPARLRPRRLDPYHVQDAIGGTFIPLLHEEIDEEEQANEVARQLQVRLTPSGKKDGVAHLAIAFGPHRLTASFKVTGRNPESSLPDPGTAIAKETQWILERALELEIYALHPEDEATGDKAFHGHRILGRAKLTPKKARQRLLAGIYRGIAAYDRTSADCFQPRHGVRASLGHLRVDLVICYECKRIQIFRDGKREAVQHPGTMDDARATVNAVFKAAGLKIAK